MFGANAFGWPYFSQAYAGVVEDTTSPPRVGGTPVSGGDLYRARIKERPPEVDLFALGQALGVIDP